MGERKCWIQPAARGVYWAAALKDGKPQLFAVDSRGNEIDRMTLDDDSWARAEAAIELFWRALDVLDPVEAKPTLALVRGSGFNLTQAGRDALERGTLS